MLVGFFHSDCSCFSPSTSTSLDKLSLRWPRVARYGLWFFTSWTSYVTKQIKLEDLTQKLGINIAFARVESSNLH